MINIQNLDNIDFLTADLELYPEIDSYDDSREYLEELSNLEQDKVHGGRWHEYSVGGGCITMRVFVK
jgi:hypothetical protein